MELNVIVGLNETRDLTMDQHKVDFSTLLSELHAEDRLFISLSISLIVKVHMTVSIFSWFKRVSFDMAPG